MRSPGAERAVRRYLLRALRHELEDYTWKERRRQSTVWLLRRKRQADRPAFPTFEEMSTPGGRMRFVLSRAGSLFSLLDDRHQRIARVVAGTDAGPPLMGVYERFRFIEFPPAKDRRRIKREQRRWRARHPK